MKKEQPSSNDPTSGCYGAGLAGLRATADHIAAHPNEFHIIALSTDADVEPEMMQIAPEETTEAVAWLRGLADDWEAHRLP